jgi:hypothetical protein
VIVILVAIAPAWRRCHDDIVLEPTAPRAPRQSGPSVWRAADVADPHEWTWELDDDEIAGLVDAGRRSAVNGPAEIEAPLLDDGVSRLTTELLRGRGSARHDPRTPPATCWATSAMSVPTRPTRA